MRRCNPARSPRGDGGLTAATPRSAAVIGPQEDIPARTWTRTSRRWPDDGHYSSRRIRGAEIAGSRSRSRLSLKGRGDRRRRGMGSGRACERLGWKLTTCVRGAGLGKVGSLAARSSATGWARCRRSDVSAGPRRRRPRHTAMSAYAQEEALARRLAPASDTNESARARMRTSSLAPGDRSGRITPGSARRSRRAPRPEVAGATGPRERTPV